MMAFVFVVVKFIVIPDGQVQQMTCSLKQSFLELRNHFASELSQPAEVILLLFNGKRILLVICIINYCRFTIQ